MHERAHAREIEPGRERLRSRRDPGCLGIYNVLRIKPEAPLLRPSEVPRARLLRRGFTNESI